MNTMLRFAFCLLLAAMLSPAPINLAEDNKGTPPGQSDDQAESTVRQFSDEEISAARETLNALPQEKRALLNHLRYLLRPQYEEELMDGRMVARCPLTPFERPGTTLEDADVLRLWAVLASGMTATDSTRVWLELFLDSPMPKDSDSLSEFGIQMALCAQGAARPELGLSDKLIERAEDLLGEATKARRTTRSNSTLISRTYTDPKWYANQMWRAVICRLALDMELEVNRASWERDLRSLIRAGDETRGWQSKAGDNNEREDLDTNLIAIAALSLAATAPDGALGNSVSRAVDESMRTVPSVLKRLDRDYAGAARVGTRLAIILSFAPELAPEGRKGESWRKSVIQLAMQEQQPSGIVRQGGSVGRTLGLVHERGSLLVCETALECIALSGGLTGGKGPLADMNLASIGRAMHALSVIHAADLPESPTRTLRLGGGHSLPEPGPIEGYMLKGLDYLAAAQHKDGYWGTARAARAGDAAKGDPGTTAFVALALMRAGHTPFMGEHKDAVMKATTFIVEAVELAEEEGPRITESTHSQLQRKLGSVVDTAIATQFLARVLHLTEPDPRLYERVLAALDKCVRKIESAQDEEGGWITSGWAPVLQSAMYNQALELAELAGREIDPTVLQRSRQYLRGDDDGSGKTVAKKPNVSAGIALYSGSSTMRAAAGDTAEVMIAMDRAMMEGTLPSSAKVDGKNLRKIGYSDEEASAKASAYRLYKASLEKLEDEKYLKGFGNNGGEEFISFMMSSESLVITGDDAWEKWNNKMRTLYKKIQNSDGSWSGHHCISSPVLCTAAVLMCLTADREAHVVVPGANPEETRGPVTGR